LAPPAQNWFLGSDIYHNAAYGRDHPLAIPRASLVEDLCRDLGWLDGGRYLESPRASVGELTRFHDPGYVAAVARVSDAGRATPRDRAEYGIGGRENPAFPGLFERATTSCGGSLEAARRVRDGGFAFNPAGGTHHGLAARAHGFCYFNDAVLAIFSMLDAGIERVCYVDFDAHHGCSRSAFTRPGAGPVAGNSRTAPPATPGTCPCPRDSAIPSLPTW
jgi:acetoin utilization protein AcuC